MKKLSKIWNVIFALFFILVLARMFGLSVSEEIDNIVLSYFEYLKIAMEWMMNSGIFPIFFIFMWLFVSYILSKKSGWAKLNEKYSLIISEKFSENIQLKLGSGKINGVSLSNCLRIGANEYGVLLKMLFLFRFGHPPLFIPWNAIKEISNEDDKKKNGLLSAIKKLVDGKFYSIKLTEFTDFELKIFKSTFDASTVPDYRNKLT